MIRFGVIGAGDIARTFSDAVNQGNGKLQAIASRNIEKAKAYKETYGYEKAYGSYEELMKNDDVDCIYIATPHGLHEEHMLLALKYNKPILCEKAFTLNYEQAKRVLDLARGKNVFVMEAMWTRFLPTIVELKKVINEGIIGEIKEIKASFGFDFRHNEKERLNDPFLGAGALLDVGIYPITFANIFLGAPLHMESKAILKENLYDLQNEIIFEYKDAKAILRSSFIENMDQSALIKGEKGYVICERFWSTEKAQIFNLNDELIQTIHIPHQKNGFEYEIQAVIQSLNQKELENQTMTHQDTLNIMKQMDELRKSWNLCYPQEKCD